MRNHQKHISFLAFLGHRISGLLLALFLPVHFYVLSLTLDQQSRLDGFLEWSNQPVVKFAEWGLIVLLAIHLTFGLRLLIIENFTWTGQRITLIWAGLTFSVIASAIFLARVF
jgi:fumarate reductase subunit D